jgi:SNF2 family DNA or RNA helicase
MGSIYSKYLGHGKISVKIMGNDFHMILANLKKNIHNLTFDKNFKHFFTFLNELDNLVGFCKNYNVDLSVTEKVLKLHRLFKKRLRRVRRARKNKSIDLNLWSDDPTCKLFPSQIIGANVCVAARRIIVGDQVGTGKTPQAIAAILKGMEYYGYETVLIVCPLRIAHQWKNEILKFTKLPESDITLISDYGKCRTGVSERFLKRNEDCRVCEYAEECCEEKEKPKIARRRLVGESKILIANYEQVRMLAQEIIDKKFDVIVCDEATKLKNRTAAVSKAMKKIALSQYPGSMFIAMSGTIIENKLQELHNIVDLVDETILGPFHCFLNRYLILDFWGQPVGVRNEEELRTKIKDVVIRRTIDDVWKERPPIMTSIRECPMSGSQLAFYKDARKGVLQELSDLEKQNSINNAALATLLNYLLQIADTMKAIDPKCKKKDHSSKFDVLKEVILEEIPKNSKVLIFSRFANKVVPHLVKWIRSLNAGEVGVVVGGSSNATGIVEAFCKGSEPRFLVCSDALAYGANLQAANYIINFDLPWNPAILDQRVARVYRRGQHKTVYVMNMIVPDTVEEHLYNVLANKRELASRFFKQSEYQKSTVSLRDLASKI